MADNDLEDDVGPDDFQDHRGVIKLLRESQSVERDVREIVREVHTFLDHKDGQWDDHARAAFKARPRYTLDKCNDLVDDIAGAMEQSDFDIQVSPAGGDATKDLAKTYDGLIRNIQNLSDASDVYDAATRNVVRAGMDGWRINQRWGDNNTFDQDLYIDTIADFVDRVWFDPNSVLQTREDAEYAFVLTTMTKRAYQQKFPKGKGRSVTIGDHTHSHSDRTPESIVVGEILYKVPVKRRIVELTTGAVYVDDEKFQKIKDELEAEGATVKRERMRDMVEVKTRIFDGDDWLTDVQNTVFDLIPIVPMYANWSVHRQVPNYWGIVTKKMDAQRIYNYVESRKVEEGALAPLAKILATKTQMGGDQKAWERLNVSTDPVLPYEPDESPGVIPPYKLGGAEINPGLETTSQSMLQNLQSTAGIDQMPGQSLGLQSGLAVELKQNRGDTRNWKYVKSKQIAVCYTGKILIRGAIPKTYDTERQVRIINEDSSVEMVGINTRVVDTRSGDPVEVIDLSKGVYDVVCEVSKSFKNRQGETVNSIVEVASIDPGIIEQGRDVLYKNMNAPGMDILAERVRQQMLLAGQIPEEQMTDDEKEFIANQPEPAPDPVVEALQRQADNDDDKIQIAAIDVARKDRELDAKIANELRDDDRESMKEAMAQVKLAAEVLNTHADTMGKIREAMGLEAISGPNGVEAFINQAVQVKESQAEQP
jgi:hypothetical protein